jgi:hypothetical protein
LPEPDSRQQPVDEIVERRQLRTRAAQLDAADRDVTRGVAVKLDAGAGLAIKG